MDLPVNRFKHAILKGERQWGAWQMLASTVATEAMAFAGYDFLVLDMEHAPSDLPEILAQLQVVGQTPTQSVVRMPWNDMVMVKRLLDIGAQTLMFPFVQTVEEAKAAVAATRYPPKGVRGVAAMHRANRYGSIPDYLARADEELCVIVQIETLEALDRIEAIAAVDGVDGVFIGPADMSAAVGRLGQIMHPDNLAAIERGAKAVRAMGKPVGIIAAMDALVDHCVAWDFTFIALGSDLAFMVNKAKATLAQHRGKTQPAAPASNY
ncbi:MAG: hypothetical protein EAZ99_19520 [Alphaproteobacteria bacterium]|nr:MAG: hypothetical protein EAZ99_19520 [Alphaproteobacteria bacterium]